MALPATQNVSQKYSGEGVTKIRKLGGILRKIIKIVATRCHILSLKRTKFDFSWGSAPHPAGGAHNTPPELLTGYEGVLLLREGKGKKCEGREGKGRKGKGRGGNGREEKVEGCVMAFRGDGRPCKHSNPVK